MIVVLVRIVLVLPILGVLYLRNTTGFAVAAVLFAAVSILSLDLFYSSFRQKILGLLADKLLFTSTLVVLGDLDRLSVVLVAWIIGIVFVHSGVDLLQNQLQGTSLDLRECRAKNWTHMVILLTILVVLALEYVLPAGAVRIMIRLCSAAWFAVTLWYLVRSFSSDKISNILQGA